jgi:hypothetical protein
MADSSAQSYSNHTRWHAPFHFFLAPVMLINFFWAAVRFVQEPGLDRGWSVVVSVALLVLTALVRTNPLRAQDRIIRLEERLRYQQLFPAELARRAASLSPGQIVALRFASDEELPALAREVIEGRLTKPSEIKRAIKSWRADGLRV